eukprot:TRINITY_DN90319_c0_g1_i1.p1 TRINITY_DN90319_c0_g1~~TRINITY_DN90319_c0_g1_i1.p1  ORF type:complete len:598 (+),score=124.72 TRINITY_DN90319_c0_g1_i1:164-1957(+)
MVSTRGLMTAAPRQNAPRHSRSVYSLRHQFRRIAPAVAAAVVLLPCLLAAWLPSSYGPRRTAKAFTAFAGMRGSESLTVVLVEPPSQTFGKRRVFKRRASKVARAGFPVKVPSVDFSWQFRETPVSDFMRLMPNSNLEDRKVLTLGDKNLRLKAKVVKADRVDLPRSVDMIEEMARIQRGPKLPGRTQRGGVMTATQLGVPSRLMLVEQTEGEFDEISEAQKALEGRDKPFLKVLFNARVTPVTDPKLGPVGDALLWEKSASIPGYKALVRRPLTVKVSGMDCDAKEAEYIAKGWEARLIQQGADSFDGIHFIDRCDMRTLQHLDAQNDPLPPGTFVGPESEQAKQPEASEEELFKQAEQGGSKGVLAGVPLVGRPNVLLAGSLLLRLRAKPVSEADLKGGDSTLTSIAKELRDNLASGRHPFGLAAPQLGKGIRAIAVQETSKQVDKLTARARTSEGHKAFGPLVLFNPVFKEREDSKTAYFFERSPSVPGYEAVVGRPEEIDVEALNEQGEKVKFTARGWQARIILHSADILDGTLYVDRMERRSFRRDNTAENLPEDVPYGVKLVTKAKSKTSKIKNKAKTSEAKKGRRVAVRK